MISNQSNTIRYPWKIWIDTFGGMAVSSLLICIISGIVLAIPYDVQHPYLSISEFSLSNAGAVIARNMHYWSAQFFLIFILLHIIDHFRISSEKNTTFGIWFRLLVSIGVILFAMLSGFMLKGDADSEQAMMIFRTLFEDIPFIGEYIAYALLGPEGTYQLLYVNHLATATIFIIIILFEHARIIWGRAITFILLGIIFLLLSILFQAPLHDNLSPIVKGPWYFVGLQEILHWMHRPGLIWLILLVVFLPLIIIPKLSAEKSRIIKYFLFLLLLVYAMLTIIGFFFRGEEWKWTIGENGNSLFDPVPVSPGTFENKQPSALGSFDRAESCMICHDGMQGFSNSHSPEAIGCVSCHLGNPFSPDKKSAHAGMLLIPGELDNASRSCGTAQCHPDITSRINTSLMSTMSGIIAVDRFVFNEQELPDGHFSIEDIGHSPADQHLRNLCVRCHLGNPKDAPGPVTEASRGGGCNACHLNYSSEAEAELAKYLGVVMPDSSKWSKHPSLDLNISDNHCFGCHSRSGRISTSYEGWHETQLKKDEISDSDTFRVLEDGRVFRYIAEDVHHKAGLNCIDCHDSYELMGDGNLYMHEEDQVKISCEDCHFSKFPKLMTVADLDNETQKIMQVKGLDNDSLIFLPLGNTGRLIWNARLNSKGEPKFYDKLSGAEHALTKPATICKRGESHKSLSCQSCHTAWVPQCIGCHNEYDPKIDGYDMIKREEVDGSWVEFVGVYESGLPALGVVEEEEKKIHTFVPGMVLSIDKSTYQSDVENPSVFHRLYAPLSAHTTTTQGRSCRSCHNDPMAIGYGNGKLIYHTESGTGRWEFIPRYANNKNDGLPEDAWIAFLQEPAGRFSTRTNTRPFTLEEQKSILLVGSCLTCHDEDSELMLSTLDDLESVLGKRTVKCVVPVY